MAISKNNYRWIKLAEDKTPYEIDSLEMSKIFDVYFSQLKNGEKAQIDEGEFENKIYESLNYHLHKIFHFAVNYVMLVEYKQSEENYIDLLKKINGSKRGTFKIDKAAFCEWNKNFYQPAFSIKHFWEIVSLSGTIGDRNLYSKATPQLQLVLNKLESGEKSNLRKLIKDDGLSVLWELHRHYQYTGDKELSDYHDLLKRFSMKNKVFCEYFLDMNVERFHSEDYDIESFVRKAERALLRIKDRKKPKK